MTILFTATILKRTTTNIGMWEAVASRTGSVKLVDAVRRNIGNAAANSADAKNFGAKTRASMRG